MLLVVDNLAFDGNFTADDDFSRFDVNPIIQEGESNEIKQV